MNIKCIDNTGINIPKEFFELSGYSEKMIFEALSLDKLYMVYAVFTLKNSRCFLICNDFYDGASYNYPMFYPSSLFKIIDNKVSKYWINKEDKNNFQTGKDNDLGFPNIINEEYFYGKLVEGYDREESIFYNYKNLIDEETLK